MLKQREQNLVCSLRVVVHEIGKCPANISIYFVVFDPDQLRIAFFVLDEPYEKLFVRERKIEFPICIIADFEISFECFGFCERESNIIFNKERVARQTAC